MSLAPFPLKFLLGALVDRARDEEPLREIVNQHAGQRQHDGSRHLNGHHRKRLFAGAQVHQGQRRRAVALPRDVNQGLEEVVPMVHEHINRRGCQNRLGKRQIDVPEDAKTRTAVDLCRVAQLV